MNSDNKLTCKLNDGREYEILLDYSGPVDLTEKIALLRPIKREPREWWIVIDGKHEVPMSFMTKEGALAHATIYPHLEMVRVREVL